MKKILILFFVSCFNSLYSQEYSFKLYRINPCDGKELIDTCCYYIRKPIDNFSPPQYPEHFFEYLKPSGQGTIALPGPGKYVLEYTGQVNSKFDTIEIKQPGVYKHKHYESKITQRAYGPFFDYTYGVCGQLANGYAEDHYKNGKLSIKGNFKNGEAKDITFYYSNGKVREEMKHSGKTYYGASYDSLGKQTCEFWSNYIKGPHSNDFKASYFYPNGKRASEFSTVKAICRTNLYFLNGKRRLKVTKNKRIDFYENGSIKDAYKWKRAKAHWEFTDSKGYGDAIVTIHKEYDTKGKLLNTSTTTEPYSNSPQATIATIGLPEWYKTELIYNYLLF